MTQGPSLLHTSLHNTKFQNPWLIWGAMGLVLGALLAWSWHLPIGDFGNYWYGSKFLTEGKFDLSIYDPFAFNQAIAARGETNFFLNYTPIPPCTALLYVPFVFLKPLVAKLLWNALTALLMVWSMKRILNFYQLDLRWALVLLVVLFFPIKSNIDQGQSYFLIFFLLAEGWMAYERERGWNAALLWAPAIALKIFPAFIIVYLLFRRDWKTIGSLLLVLLLCFGITLIWMDHQIWSYYITEVLARLSDGAINDPYAHSYQSMQVLLKNIFIPDALLNPDALFDSSSAYVIGYSFFRAAIFGLMITHLHNPHSHLEKWSVVLLAGLLLTGYGSTYSLIFLLPLLLLLITQGLQKRTNQFLFVLLLIACAFPVYLTREWPVWLAFPRLICLLVVYFAMTLRGKRLVPRLTWIAAIAIMSWTIWSSYPILHPQASKWISNQQPLLNGKLEFREETKLNIMQVAVTSFSIEGIASTTYLTGINTTDTLPTTYSRHEIDVQGQRYVFPQEQIKQAVAGLEDGVLTIYYLSDWGRGPGFYALRVKRIHEQRRKGLSK